MSGPAGAHLARQPGMAAVGVARRRGTGVAA